MIAKKLREFASGLGGVKPARAGRFSKAYLHIGLGKTGSSTIQRSLLANSDALNEQHDLYFPSQFSDPRRFDGNHSLYLGSLFGSRPLGGKQNIAAGIRTESDLKRANAALLRDFEQGFNKSDASRVLISAERIGHMPRDNLRSVRDWLQNYAETIQVVACLRHPQDALSSTVQQRVKAGGVLEELYENPPHYRFSDLLTRLEHVFGRENLVLYDFVDALESPGGIVGGFFEQLGVDPGFSVEAEEIVNESFSHEAVLLFSALNQQRPLLVGTGLGELRTEKDILMFAAMPGRKFEVPGPVRDTLSDAVKPHLQWLSENYGINLRERPRPECEPYRQFSADSIERIARLLSDFSLVSKR